MSFSSLDACARFAFDNSSRHLLVTGGTRGIGTACALLFAEVAATVAAIYSSHEEAADRLRAHLADSAGNYRVLRCDMADQDAVRSVVNSLDSDGRLPSVLICNTYQKKATVSEADVSHMDRTFAVNVFGNYVLLREVADRVARDDVPGAIVVNSSNQSVFVNPAAFAYSLTRSALTEPIAVCVFGCIERARIKPTDSVVIYGMGSIGSLTLVVLLDAGVESIVCVTPIRRGMQRFRAAEEIGAPRVASTDTDVGQAVEEPTGNTRPDCVVECSGAPAVINEGMQLLRKDGTFVALGIGSSDEIPFRYNTGVLSAIHLMFSSTTSRTSWITSLGILERRSDRIDRIITHTMSLDEWDTVYEKLENRDAIKAVLIP